MKDGAPGFRLRRRPPAASLEDCRQPPDTGFALRIFVFAILQACCLGSHALMAEPLLPQGVPPEPGGRRIDVSTYGADLADNGNDDSRAVAAAVEACTNHSTLYFPAGTYNLMSTVPIAGFDGLSLQGDGVDRSVVKRMGPYWRDGEAPTWENLVAAGGNDCRLFTIGDCRNMCIRDLGFDANGTPTFGGVNLSRCKRLHITHTRYLDSREAPAFAGRDRFAWVILGHGDYTEDLWFTDNVVEGLQTEIDNARRVLVEGNLLRRSVKSPGIGFLSANFAAGELLPGYSNLDITVRHNYISNAAELSMGLIVFQLDPPHNCGSVFREIDILDNLLVFDIPGSADQTAIKIGTGDNSAPTLGNVFERFRVEGNAVYRAPGIQLGEPEYGYIWNNTSRGTHRLNFSIIRNNVLYTDRATDRKPFIQIMKQEESLGLVIEDNRELPYEDPPWDPAAWLRSRPRTDQAPASTRAPGQSP
jgi:hypothetical protein